MDQARNGGMDLVVFGASGDLARRKVLPASGAVARGRVARLGSRAK
jgi:glucose-6-phosphate 1-dehydrogenase